MDLEKLREAADSRLSAVQFTETDREQVRARLKGRKKSRLRWAIPAAAAAAAGVLAVSLLLSRPALSVKAEDLMEGVTPFSVEKTRPSDEFLSDAADFSVRLFQQTLKDSSGNGVVSPMSLYAVLSMLAAGAAGDTRAELDALLGSRTAPAERENMLAWLLDRWPVEENGRVHLASSVWYDERVTVEPAFLRKNAGYFHAAAYRAAFSDPRTLKDMNNWVRYHTDGLIRDGLASLPSDAAMVLMNTVLFDMEWREKYEKKDVYPEEFRRENGEKVTVDFLHSTEDSYMENEIFTGFSRDYKGGRYRFVGLLPREGLSLSDAADTLTGEGWLQLMQGAGGEVKAAIPCFAYACTWELNETLQALGVKDAFDPLLADFSPTGRTPEGGLYLDEVGQKTRIELDEHGTKAAAFTWGMMNSGSAPPEEVPIVRLDRPFLYAIVDSGTGLPLFLGAVADPSAG